MPKKLQPVNQASFGKPARREPDGAHVVLLGDLVCQVLRHSVLGDVDRLQAGIDVGSLVELDGVILLLDGGTSVLKEVGLPLGNGEDARKSLL